MDIKRINEEYNGTRAYIYIKSEKEMNEDGLMVDGVPTGWVRPMTSFLGKKVICEVDVSLDKYNPGREPIIKFRMYSGWVLTPRHIKKVVFEEDNPEFFLMEEGTEDD